MGTTRGRGMEAPVMDVGQRRQRAVWIAGTVLVVLALVQMLVLAAADPRVQSLVYHEQYSAHLVDPNHCSVVGLGCFDHKKDLAVSFDAAIDEHYSTFKLFPTRISPEEYAALKEGGANASAAASGSASGSGSAAAAPAPAPAPAPSAGR